ncbi:NADPH-dependent FMN reductase [Leifsonia sp. RAF41]|uniref:NADPH-dependent FMN reductase n=1 Tax=Leifsonia sp. RAF41 TaxID=3233056 RepID=UPI003F995771
MTSIAIIIGSTRPGRKGEEIARWVQQAASERPGVSYDLVDLVDFPLPHLDEVIPPAMGQYANEHTRNWAAKIAQYDGYIFVTPEYNHSTSGVLKNALDYIYAEWNNKAAGFVSYGSVGGTRAVEHLRLIAAELQMATVRSQVALSLFTDYENFVDFAPGPQHDDALSNLFAQLEGWSVALAQHRASTSSLAS